MLMPSFVAKILVAGPVGSGKSTFVRTLSDTPFVDTDVMASEEIGKLATTVGIDFGTRNVDDLRILLFGVPGQERFDFMWEVTCDGAQGLVLLVASDRPACFIEAKRTLKFLRDRIEVPVIIGLTRSDIGDSWDFEEVAAYLNVPPECIVTVDARDVDSCMDSLRMLFEYVTPKSNLLTPEESFSLV
ncbi:MAG: ATP/GTP-binding protein [Bryobacterales bacterium]|nr:ATP/GTP-binding protein [Bryobacterales bacterium]